MKRYWVIGGNYADTKFDRMQDGGPEQKFGPFRTYEEAKAEWQRRAWSTVDNASARYRIEEETGDTWWNLATDSGVCLDDASSTDGMPPG